MIFIVRKCTIVVFTFLWYLAPSTFNISDCCVVQGAIVENTHVCETKEDQTNGVEAVDASITTRDAVGPFYTADTPWTNRIAPEEQLAIPTNRLVFQGSVVGRNCQPLGIPILVEPWYAGLPDDQGNLYSPLQGGDKRYRGRFYTDECGNFQYSQTFPEVYQARDIRHIHFKFTTTTTEEPTSLATQIYFRDYLPTKYNGYLQGRESQIVDIHTNTTTGERTAYTTIVLNVDGTDVYANTTCNHNNNNNNNNNNNINNSASAPDDSVQSSSPSVSATPPDDNVQSPTASTPSMSPSRTSAAATTNLAVRRFQGVAGILLCIFYHH